MIIRIRIISQIQRRRLRHDLRFRALLVWPLGLRRHRRKHAVHHERAQIDNDPARAGAGAPMGVTRRKLHLDRGHPAGVCALEMRKVPPRGDEVGPHALDGVHEHAGPFHRLGFAVGDDVPGALVARPEAVYDVSVRSLNVRAKVGEPAMRPLAHLVPWDGGGPLHIEGQLQVRGQVGGDSVRLGILRAGIRLECDGELVAFAGAFVEAWRWGDKVGDVDGFPDGLSGLWVVQLACELHGRIPEAVVQIRKMGLVMEVELLTRRQSG